MAKLASLAFISVDGQALATLPGASLTFGGMHREGVFDDRGGHDHTESHVASRIEFSIKIKSDTEIKSLTEKTEATITIETNNGRVYTIGEAYCSEDETTINFQEGTASFIYYGAVPEESTGAST